MSNFLNPQNCNKTHCKSCIFHPNIEKRILLSKARIAEIEGYLSRFKSSHICHNTNKTCYGGLQFQSELLFRMGLIPENNVESLLKTAQKFL